jgi:hypothetical protein
MSIIQKSPPIYDLHCDLCDRILEDVNSVPTDTWSTIVVQIRGYQQAFNACEECTHNGPKLPSKEVLFKLMGLPAPGSFAR